MDHHKLQNLTILTSLLLILSASVAIQISTLPIHPIFSRSSFSIAPTNETAHKPAIYEAGTAGVCAPVELSVTVPDGTIGDTLTVSVTQQPYCSLQSGCFYSSLDVIVNGHVICAASGFDVNNNTRTCLWNTELADFTPGTYTASVFYGGHSDCTAEELGGQPCDLCAIGDGQGWCCNHYTNPHKTCCNDEPKTVYDDFVLAPAATPAPNLINWETPYVSLHVNNFNIDVNGHKFFTTQNSFSLNSSPPSYDDYESKSLSTIEGIWQENGVEMRMFIFFKTDGVNWWSDEIRTYNGAVQGEWIYYQNNTPFFLTPIGQEFTGSLTFNSSGSETGNDSGIITFENLRLQAFIPNPVNWSTNHVTLTAADFHINAGGDDFLDNTGDLTVSSDPGNNNYTTLETTWNENNNEMRLFMYLYADETKWWVSEIRTRDNQEPAEWVYYTGPFFESPLHTAYNVGAVTLNSDDGQAYPTSIYFRNLSILPIFGTAPTLTPTPTPTSTPTPSCGDGECTVAENPPNPADPAYCYADCCTAETGMTMTKGDLDLDCDIDGLDWGKMHYHWSPPSALYPYQTSVRPSLIQRMINWLSSLFGN